MCLAGEFVRSRRHGAVQDVLDTALYAVMDDVGVDIVLGHVQGRGGDCICALLARLAP